MSTSLAAAVLGGSFALLLYTYAVYPALLWSAARVRSRALPRPGRDAVWPTVSISIPAYNERGQIRDLLDSILALDYPRDRLQVLVVSDASSDGTDEIVAEYAHRGVELLHLAERGGKTKAENAALPHLRGAIVVNTDASVRIRADALRPLIAVFQDPEIGCASGRDVSVGASEDTSNRGESTYVGYEMAIRDLETSVSGIVGASGCFYAIRADLHRLPLEGRYSRDFAAALRTTQNGYRAVSVSDAVCYVPRTTSLRSEYRRKVRTITRGMGTLWHLRELMNPIRHGVYAWMLVSHKVCRWALPWAATASWVALAVLAPSHPLFAALFALGAAVAVLALVGWLLAERPRVPGLFSVPAYLVSGNLAAAHALVRVVAGIGDPLWEPTRR
jgi:cellulose synthase/poly-beta-1,6-N-acetylglucosamine synthase-like glycosyltransferase